MEGETLTTSQTSTMKLSNFDKIDQIIVPKEVLDAAVEYDFGS
nr:DUF6612 family protein [Bacillus kwashiorkori]